MSTTLLLVVNLGFGNYVAFFICLFVEVVLVTVVCFLLGESPASEIYMQTFRNTLSVPSS